MRSKPRSVKSYCSLKPCRLKKPCHRAKTTYFLNKIGFTSILKTHRKVGFFMPLLHRIY
ncbi:hypothetical protein MGSAQ_000724 [marine sediment metagenome]|uniref:Uncharacterized protein n=1 Tax=marine sediment metagenome TaxID=412755 RepID=A0A1B6NWI4_9ZZZZ